MNIRRYFGSMAGRMFLILLAGVFGASAIALAFADARRVSDLSQVRAERIGDRMGVYLTMLDNASPQLREELLSKGVPAMRRVTGEEIMEGPDAKLTQQIAPRLKTLVDIKHASPPTCFEPSLVKPFYDQIECWVVHAKLSDGQDVYIQLKSPREINRNYGLDLTFLSILGIGIAALVFFSARMAALPLRNLSQAARDLGGDLNALPLPESGPTEVREAAEAFNAMQAKLRDHVVERTQMLASITHDLQTPMTRLRLRLEKVDDPALRSRLIDDLGVMQLLIREGLDYARSNQTDEPFGQLALDDLLDILVEDASEGGASVRFRQRCHSDVEARPRALQRCLANLVDNAVKYGEYAEISAQWIDGRVEVRVRDNGPGIPEDLLEQATKPFVRLDPQSTADGVGLGLTIAKTLAEKNGADLTLTNLPGGGLEALLTLHRGVSALPPETTPQLTANPQPTRRPQALRHRIPAKDAGPKPADDKPFRPRRTAHSG